VKVGPGSMVPCPALNAEDSTRANLQMGPMGVHSKEARFHTQRVAGLKVLEVAHVGVGEMILWEHEQDKRELDQWFECVTRRSARPPESVLLCWHGCVCEEWAHRRRAATSSLNSRASAGVAATAITTPQSSSNQFAPHASQRAFGSPQRCDLPRSVYMR
jgi:hypothetical protein